MEQVKLRQYVRRAIKKLIHVIIQHTNDNITVSSYIY